MGHGSHWLSMGKTETTHMADFKGATLHVLASKKKTVPQLPTDIKFNHWRVIYLALLYVTTKYKFHESKEFLHVCKSCFCFRLSDLF